MKKLTKGLLAGLCAVVGLSAVATVAMIPAQVETPAVQAETTYTTKDVAMMAYIDNEYAPNGNFRFLVTLSELDYTEAQSSVPYDTTVDDMPGMLKGFDFFNKVKINGYTLEELGCTSVWENAFDVNAGGGAPNYKLCFHMHADPTIWNQAINDGKVVFGVGSNVTITEGTLIPSYAYLTGDHTATVYRAGCDYVGSASSVTYGIESAGKTDVESVKYVQGHDGVCGYFGVSLYGDDYAGAQLEIVNHNSGKFAANRFETKILVNGQAGLTGKYGLYGLGEKGQGYFSFQMNIPEEEMESITIPAGTTFPTRAMSVLRPLNGGNGVYIMYETQTDVTFYKQANGSWSTTELEEEPVIEEKETSISKMEFGEGFVILYLTNNDYPTNAGTIDVKGLISNLHFYDHVEVDGNMMASGLYNIDAAFINVWNRYGSIATYLPGHITPEEKVVIKAGCQIPTYNALVNGAKECYATKEDVTFLKNANGEWISESAYIPEEVKNAAIEEIQNYNTAKDDALYFAEQVAARAEIVGTASEKIDMVGSADQIPAIVAEAKAAIDAVATKASIIESAQAEIEAYKSQDGYFAEKEAAERAQIVADKKEVVASAESASAVANIVKEAKAAIDMLLTAAEAYVAEDTVMMARIGSWYGNGNFTLAVTLAKADWTSADNGGKTYEGDLALLLKKLGFFDHIVILGKTLAEWGCEACHMDGGNYALNVGEPANVILFRLSMSNENAAKATEAGFANSTLATISAGAIIPSYGYLTGQSDVVYSAAVDYVATSSAKAFGFEVAAKTEVDGMKYVQDFNVDEKCGYFGVSFVGDDYLADGTQLEINPNWKPENAFNTKILVNGESGKTKYYGLFNLGENGKGYYSFQIALPADEIISITIPAGTRFPARAMMDLSVINNDNPVFFSYEIAEDITLYNSVNGFVSYEEYIALYGEAQAAELESYKAGAFRDAEEAQRLAIIADAKVAIADAADINAIDALVADAKMDIDELKTAAQYADEELAAVKAEANAEIEGYLADVAYLEEQAAVKAEAIAAGLAAVAAAVSEEEIQAAVVAAKAAVDAIETKASIVAAAVADIDAYKTDVVYFDEQAAEKAAIVEDAKAAVEAASSEAAIAETVANAKAAIDAIKTKAELEEEALAGVKVEANATVDALKKAVDFDLYADDAVATINGLYTNVKAAIANATSEEEINAAVAAFETALAEVPQKGSEEDENKGDAPSTDDVPSDESLLGVGCFGAIGGLAYGMVMLGAAVVLLKKKQN